MKPSEWPRRNGVHYPTAWQWAREGKMPVPVTRTRLLRDPSASLIVVEYRDRAARFGFEQLPVAFEASRRRIVVIDDDEAAPMSTTIWSAT